MSFILGSVINILMKHYDSRAKAVQVVQKVKKC
jgi:hypothetical protein